MHVNQQIKRVPLTGTFRQRLYLPPLPPGLWPSPLSSAALTLRHIKTVIHSALVACAAFGAPCNILITTNIYCILMWSRAMSHSPFTFPFLYQEFRILALRIFITLTRQTKLPLPLKSGASLHINTETTQNTVNKKYTKTNTREQQQQRKHNNKHDDGEKNRRKFRLKLFVALVPVIWGQEPSTDLTKALAPPYPGHQLQLRLPLSGTWPLPLSHNPFYKFAL